MLALGGYKELIEDGLGLAERWVGSIAAGPIVAVQALTPAGEAEAEAEVVGTETAAVGHIAGEGTAAAGTVEADIVAVAEEGIRLRANSQINSSRKRHGLPIQWISSHLSHPSRILFPSFASDITYHYNPSSVGLP